MKQKIVMKERKTYTFAGCRVGKGDRHLLDGTATKGIPLPLGREQSELFLLIFTERVAVPGWQRVSQEKCAQKFPGHLEIKTTERF